jgi:hypothetical protein
MAELQELFLDSTLILPLSNNSRKIITAVNNEMFLHWANASLSG